jgi:hypothetical protein
MEIVRDKRGKVLQPAMACTPRFKDAGHRTQTTASVTRIQLKLLQ